MITKRLAHHYPHIFSLIHLLLLDEFAFIEMKTCGQFKISSCCLCVWCKSRELEGRRSRRFSTLMVEKFSADHRSSTIYKTLLGRVAFGIIYVALAKSWSVRDASHQSDVMDSCLAISHTRLACIPS